MMAFFAVFLPLVSAVFVGLLNKNLTDRQSQWFSCSAMVISAFLSLLVFFKVAFGQQDITLELFTWIQSGEFNVHWSISVDTLSAVMMVVVNLVSCLVHVYSVGYMSHDQSVPRFMAYLSLFTFFMLMLVTADNFLQMFFGWEGVGLASYLLIGFWFHKESANRASIKAFLVNRVGDFGFALGIITVFVIFGSLDFTTVFSMVPEVAGQRFEFLGNDWDILTVACILLFIGAMGKSAQLGLHTWLPDAMEGPTPVSALIHAATMVTAGVFMVTRLSPMFEYAPVALQVVCVVGGLTAFFAATVGVTQNDIKRVIAYSTCSQLGYMFFACGVSAYQAAMFHLMTHAFFKALLFLGSGSVIHALSGEQDLRKMGGLWRLIPWTYGLMWVGSLALAGIPFFAGYYSKDIILESAFAAGTPFGYFAFVMGIAAALLTAFYSWRLLFLTFHGTNRSDEKVLAHVHESPSVMLIPLMILALGAMLTGFLGYPFFVGDAAHEFWRDSIVVLDTHHALHDAHHVELWVKILPLVVAVSGIGLAYRFYIQNPRLPNQWAQQWKPIYEFSYNKWFFDPLYQAVFIRPALYLGNVMWKIIDTKVIDGLGPNGVAWTTQVFARVASRAQTGYVFHYATVMIVGVLILLTWIWVKYLGFGG